MNNIQNQNKQSVTAMNVLRLLYHGSIIELNGEARFARAMYFVKRGLKLTNTHIIYNGLCYYLINYNVVEMEVKKNAVCSSGEVAA
jgi:hypothetical protein